MKREILFKARCIADGRWVVGCFLEDATDGCGIYKKENQATYFVDPKTVSQYTGLVDRKGNMVFENDVLQSAENEEAYGIVGWNPHGFWCISASRYYVLNPDVPLGKDAQIETNKTMLVNCTVVGNIWDDDVREELFGLLKYSEKE